MRLRVCGLSLAAMLALLGAPELRAYPLKDTKRMISGETVNLSPLFRWWTNHTGPRPLNAWAHLTGRVVGTNAWGWIIEARTGDRSTRAAGKTGRVVLYHPPLAERAEFDRLSAQLKELERQRAAMADAAGAAGNRAGAVAKEERNYREVGLRNRRLAREHRVLKISEEQAKAELKPLDQQIQELKKQLSAFPNPDHYEVDCFALETGEQYQRLRVYDYGSAL